MKATIVLCMLLGLATWALVGEPSAMAAGLTTAVGSHPARTAERTADPLLMIVSGATLLALASAVRRYIP
jgi:hypothetical protein